MRKLTEREQQVLECMALGLSDKQIAYRLHIRLGTVKSHVGNILRKTEAANRTQAVTNAIASGTLRSILPSDHPQDIESESDRVVFVGWTSPTHPRAE
jgi:DNA-binding CsgD family transcriptional regulator